MIDCQIRPSNVKNQELLQAISLIQREKFLPSENSSLAYSDSDLLIDGDRSILSPRLITKMIDALGVTKNDNILSLAPGLGYSSALMASLCDFVVAVEREGIAEDTQRQLIEGGFDNVIVKSGDIAKGAPEHGPYDALIVEGGIEFIPEELVKQIKLGGRIIAIFVRDRFGECNLGITTSLGVDWRALFETGCFPLTEFKKEEEFVL